MYSRTTNEIRVTVAPQYLDAQSSPEEGEFIWAYQVKIENTGAQSVQLKTRHWRITDARGHTETVQGAGVVGEEPVLAPGAVFEYVSGAPLPTPSGIMQGSYGMVRADGTMFEAVVPAFSLDSPHERTTRH